MDCFFDMENMDPDGQSQYRRLGTFDNANLSQTRPDCGNGPADDDDTTLGGCTPKFTPQTTGCTPSEVDPDEFADHQLTRYDTYHSNCRSCTCIDPFEDPHIFRNPDGTEYSRKQLTRAAMKARASFFMSHRRQQVFSNTTNKDAIEKASRVITDVFKQSRLPYDGWIWRDSDDLTQMTEGQRIQELAELLNVAKGIPMTLDEAYEATIDGSKVRPGLAGLHERFEMATLQ